MKATYDNKWFEGPYENILKTMDISSAIFISSSG